MICFMKNNVVSVDAEEDDALALVEPGVEEVGYHHEHQLGVIVGPDANEAVSVTPCPADYGLRWGRRYHP